MIKHRCIASSKQVPASTVVHNDPFMPAVQKRANDGDCVRENMCPRWPGTMASAGWDRPCPRRDRRLISSPGRLWHSVALSADCLKIYGVKNSAGKTTLRWHWVPTDYLKYVSVDNYRSINENTLNHLNYFSLYYCQKGWVLAKTGVLVGRTQRIW